MSQDFHPTPYVGVAPIATKDSTEEEKKGQAVLEPLVRLGCCRRMGTRLGAAGTVGNKP